jgi:deazaflavin-dependent oxidoreductase (nitroreductase family)
MNNEKLIQQAFKYFNKLMVLMWRLGWGPWINIWPKGMGRIMVITHTGRKSGLPRRTPVNYAMVDDDLYCTAGFGRGSDWYRNILSNPQVDVWLPDGWWVGVAEEVHDTQKRLVLLREVIENSGFAAYVFGVNPYKLDDEQLAAITVDYRLLRIRRTAARTGPGGPGDLAPVMSLVAFFLLPLALRKRSSRNSK